MDQPPAGTYDLQFDSPLNTGSLETSPEIPHSFQFPAVLQLYNAKSFCRMRWVVAIGLVLFGIIWNYQSSELRRLGFVLYSGWPFLIAGLLALTNLLYLFHLAYRERVNALRDTDITANLWAQIVIDLLLLTYVVYEIGGLVSYVPFFYALHIILSCMFLSPGHSLIVTFLAIIFYGSCLALQLSQRGFLSFIAALSAGDVAALQLIANTVTISSIWLIAWYLVSNLSKLLLRLYHEVSRTNEQMLATQKERNRHMLRTTHELKAPFAAIHANMQLLLKGYCGEFTDDARDVLNQIAIRSRHLSKVIQSMLQLANLASSTKNDFQYIELDIAEVIRKSLEFMQPLAEERKITIETALEPVQARAVEDHLRMLFNNLLSNAIVYSHLGGKVRVTCTTLDSGRTASCVIEDNGIGIPAEKIPRIFDEYYRTEAAAMHNKGSTGLGLAIVRQIAGFHNISIRVESTPEVGTRFIVKIPL